MSITLTETIEKLQFSPHKSLPIITQTEAAECGLACLAMISGYYGHQIDLLSLRQKFNISIGGMTLQDIMQFAGSLDLTSRPLKVELCDLEYLQTPCILHWDLNHFVVLKSANSKSIVIHDPVCGEIKMAISKASDHFTGIALELKPTNKFEKKKQLPQLKLSDFLTNTIGLKKSLTLIFTLSLLLQIFILASPYYMQLVVDDVILTGDTSLLTVLAIGFSLVLLFEIGTNSLRSLTILHFGNMLNIQLGANLFHHLIRLPMQYFEKRHIGDVVSRFGSLQQIRQLLTTGITESIIDGMMAVITFILIFFYSPKLALVVLFITSIYSFIRFITYRPIHNITNQEISSKAIENSNFMETVRGIQTIKLFGTEPKREGLWQNYHADTINKSIQLGNFKIGFSALNRLIFGFGNIVIIYLAANLVVNGGFSTGMLFAFMAYKNQFVTKITSLIDKLIEFKMLSLHFERLADIALTEEEVQNENLSNFAIQGKITINNISYRYSDTTPNVINSLSFQITPGESVAITGPSGCGKSTLMKIMLGLNTPQEGDVLIDDIKLNQIGNFQYRKQIAAVMQNDELLSGSIADNIAFFDSPIDMERVVYCAKQASVHNDIKAMPMGYNSLVGDMGSSLSGGQKQRVILARALYKKPRILFMDEATSHLDVGLESDINNAIKKMNITRVIIAHRKETIASADREICLKNTN